MGVIAPCGANRRLTPPQLLYTSAGLSPIFDLIDTKYMKAFLTKFSAYRTRYYRSATGRESQLFLLSTLEAVRFQSHRQVA